MVEGWREFYKILADWAQFRENPSEWERRLPHAAGGRPDWAYLQWMRTMDENS